MEEDLRLVRQVLNGNIDSFSIIVNKYELLIIRFIYNMVKDKEAAEDISQEVFISCYNKLYTFNEEYKFSNWIFQIARNKCIDYIRKYRRVYEANMEEVNEIESKDESPEEIVNYKEAKKRVEEFISTLNEVDREILILRYSEENMTFLDIAHILNMNESNVKRRYYKARDKFKEFKKEKERRCR